MVRVSFHSACNACHLSLMRCMYYIFGYGSMLCRLETSSSMWCSKSVMFLQPSFAFDTLALGLFAHPCQKVNLPTRRWTPNSFKGQTQDAWRLWAEFQKKTRPKVKRQENARQPLRCWIRDLGMQREEFADEHQLFSTPCIQTQI